MRTCRSTCTWTSTSWTAPTCPGCDFPAGPGPTLGDVENCLTAITASVDVVAAGLACAWLPGQVGMPPAREAIARLAGALGARLTWPH